MSETPIAGDFVGAKMLAVLACVEAALDAAGRPVGLSSLTPGGLPAWDNCCEGGGQLYVRVIRQFPTTGPGAPFPNVDTQQSCGVSEVGVELGVGVIRCVHSVDDNGQAPTGAEMTGDTLGTTADAMLVLQALRCCVEDPVKIGAWSPQGASGGCAGGEWTLVVPTGVCACP